jgi:hypothetical protein
MIHSDDNFLNPMWMKITFCFKTEASFIEKNFSDLNSFLFSV